jgi:O-antigen/teichoic acid export membrane protein
VIVVLSRNQQITGLTGLNAIGWGSLAAAVLGIGLAKPFFTHRPGHVMSIWRENWQFGRWILGASLSEWVVVNLYPIMMAGLISFAATGVYQTLQNLVAPIHVLMRAIDTFTTPILAKTFDQAGFEKFKRNLKRIYIISGIPILGFLLLVVLFTPQLLFLLAEDTYLPYADGIYVMAIFYLLLFINRPLQLAFRAIRKGKQIFLANILAMVSMFTVGIWMINRWGIYGAIGGQALNALIIILVLGLAWVKFSRTVENDT